jgi:hypothetical protein
VAEWSKATDSRSVLFGGVSSNLTGCNEKKKKKKKKIFFFNFTQIDHIKEKSPVGAMDSASDF